VYHILCRCILICCADMFCVIGFFLCVRILKVEAAAGFGGSCCIYGQCPGSSQNKVHTLLLCHGLQFCAEEELQFLVTFFMTQCIYRPVRQCCLHMLRCVNCKKKYMSKKYLLPTAKTRLEILSLKAAGLNATALTKRISYMPSDPRQIQTQSRCATKLHVAKLVHTGRIFSNTTINSHQELVSCLQPSCC